MATLQFVIDFMPYMVCTKNVVHIENENYSTVYIYNSIDISSFQWPEPELERQGGTCRNLCQHMQNHFQPLWVWQALACMPMRTCPQPSRRLGSHLDATMAPWISFEFTHECTYCVKDGRVSGCFRIIRCLPSKLSQTLWGSCTETIVPSIVHDL